MADTGEWTSHGSAWWASLALLKRRNGLAGAVDRRYCGAKIMWFGGLVNGGIGYRAQQWWLGSLGGELTMGLVEGFVAGHLRDWAGGRVRVAVRGWSVNWAAIWQRSVEAGTKLGGGGGQMLRLGGDC
ncbi:hypothetical protein TIFTF001_050489, partial [Ficus carica]